MSGSAVDEGGLWDGGLSLGEEAEQMGVGRFDKMRLDTFAAGVAVLAELKAQAGWVIWKRVL
jgi:hypothetical protein